VCSSDLVEAARAVLDLGCRVALKNGADGGVLWEADDSVHRVPAPPITPVDTTGAGDSFDAGFISGMVEGLPGQECLARAVRCGSLSTRAVGGTAGQPSRTELGAV
jgi:sugar/nucleoside kinase (ribokinase family)